MSENEKIEQAELEAALEAEATESVVKAEKSKPAKSDKDKGDGKKAKKPGVFKRIAKWFKEMKSELKKVQWPTWKQTLKSTGIVILCVIIVGAFIWVFDALATSVVGALLRLFGKG